MILRILLHIILIHNSTHGTIKCDGDQIVGKWKITDVEVIRDPTQIIEEKEKNLIVLFGPEAWAEATGKHFDFKTNGDLETDIMEPYRSLSGLSEQEKDDLMNIPLRYTCDSNLVISCTQQDKDFHYEVNIDLVAINGDQMIWEVGMLHKVTMKKE
mgnify:CR=1 FL=1